MTLRPLSEAVDFELEPGQADPTGYVAIGAADFVLGWVKTLIVDEQAQEVRYLVVNTRRGNYRDGRDEDRLIPLAWVELVNPRRQVRLPHLSRLGFEQLPLYRAGEPVPAQVVFPRLNLDDPDLRDIA